MKYPFAWGLILALAVLLVYHSVFSGGAFGVNDDYQYLQRVYTGTFDPANNEQAGMGRQAAAWMLDAGYWMCAGSVANLVYLRLVSLVGICLLTAGLRHVFQRGGLGSSAAGVAALCVAFSPACGVYAAWAAAFLCPFALALCLFAGWLLQDVPSNRSQRWLRVAGACALILLACSLWQAAAPMALFAGFADAWRRTTQNSASAVQPKTRGLVSAWAIVAASVIAYLLLHRLAVRFGWVRGAGLDRMTLTGDLRSKFWLFGELLRSGFTSWARLHSPGWEALVAGGTALACLGTLRPSVGAWVPSRFPVRRLLLAAGMLVASIAPLLAAGENNASFRALPVLYTTVAFLAVEGACRWASFRSRGQLLWFRPVAGTVLLALLGVCASYHVRAGIVAPNALEYKAVSKLVQRQFRIMPSCLVYLPPPPVLLAPESMKPSWEYGIVSSPFWWVVKPFLLDIFRAQGRCADPKADNLEIFFREVGHEGVPVLNPMPEMLREPGQWRDDARWGRVMTFSGGWMYSPWLGYLNVKKFPIVQHHILGAMLCIGGKGDDIWLHKEGLGNFYTSKVSFPYLFVNERHDWVYLLDTDRSHCSVRDPAGHRWALTE